MSALFRTERSNVLDFRTTRPYDSIIAAPFLYCAEFLQPNFSMRDMALENADNRHKLINALKVCTHIDLNIIATANIFD